MDPKKSIQPVIEASLISMTAIEKSIAHYFLTNYPVDISAETLSKKLFVSQSSLTRFAKKCGFEGYREFVYEYQKYQQHHEEQFSLFHHNLTKRVLADYDEILSKTYALVDEKQIQLISKWIEAADRVYFYGQGSSGQVAQEMKMRFMRLGVICEAVTDSHMLRWMENLIDDNCLVIALSISGKSTEVLAALEKAHDCGAKTVILTTQKMEHSLYDEILLVASSLHLSYGNRISPQFPLLVMADLLYAYFMSSNPSAKEANFKRTIIRNE